MTTIAVCSDCHIGNHRRFGGPTVASINDRCRMVLAAFDLTCTRVIENEADVFIVAGDLLDYSRPEAPILREIQKSLRRLKEARIRTLLLVGNHEQTSTYPGDHALSPLAPYAVIVEQARRICIGDAELLLVPFQPGAAKDWLPDAIHAMLTTSEDADEKLASPPASFRRILSIHLGIRDARTPPWLANAADAIDVGVLSELCAEHSISHVFAGNWHDRRAWTRSHANGSSTSILQIGALVPTGWDNPSAWDDDRLGPYGALALLRDQKLSYETIPGPRFVKCRSEKEARAAAAVAKRDGHQLFVSIEAAPEQMAQLATWGAGCAERGEMVACDVLPDQTIAKQEAKNAAAAATGANNIDEALTNFVEHMPLPESLDRQSILRRAKGYL